MKERRDVCTGLAAAVMALMVAGCSTTNPYTGEQQTANATTGAAIGAVAGAAIGGVSSSKSDRGKGALIGAASGAALGGGIGYYMDLQEAELRNQLQSTGVSVTRDGNNIILNMPNEITFDVDKTDLSIRAIQALTNVAVVAKEYEQTQLNIYGFTDSTGSEAYNMRLSQLRANEVSQQLIREGVAVRRLVIKGMGEAHPIATNETAQGRAENRRVEIVLSPSSS